MALTDKLANIANAIRARTGKTGELTLDQMVEEINALASNPDFIESGVTCNDAYLEYYSGSIRRCGNLVLAEMMLYVTSDIPTGAVMFSFNDGWRPKEASKQSAYYVEPSKTTPDWYDVFVDLRQNDVNVYCWNPIPGSSEDSPVHLYLQLYFEAEPLT